MAIRDGFIDEYFEDPNEMGANNYTAELATQLLTPPAPAVQTQVPADDPMGQAEQQAAGINAQTLMNSGPMMPSKPGPFTFQQKRYKQELQQYKIEKEQFDSQQYQKQMHQLASMTNDPMMQAGLKSGNTDIQEQIVSRMFGKQSGAVNFNQYQQFDPQQKRQFDRFKGRDDELAPTTIQRNLQAAGFTPGSSEYQQAMIDYIQKPQNMITMGGIPSGSERVPAPKGTPGGGTVLRPQMGSKEYTAANESYLRSGQSVSNVEKMSDLISKHGSEMFGKTSGTMGALYGQILADVADLQNKGVLQQGEMEMIQKQLTDPTSPAGARTSTDTMLSQYKQLSELLQNKQQMEGQKFKRWGYELPSNEETSSDNPYGLNLPKGWKVISVDGKKVNE